MIAATQSSGTGLILLLCCAGLAVCAMLIMRDRLGVRRNAKRWWEL